MNGLINFNAISNNQTINEKLKSILSVKFKNIAAFLQSVLKIASKGNRKGLLIFNTTASNEIYNIKDTFTKFIVRSIYDQYKDFTNGIIFRIHINELFSGDFLEAITRQLNATVDSLYTQYEYINKAKYKDLLDSNYEAINKYSEYGISYNKDNIFNVNNIQSKPYFEDLNQLKNMVQKQYPKVRLIEQKIENDYSLRKLKEELIQKHKNRFNEFILLNNERQNLQDKRFNEMRAIKEEINKEMEKDNLIELKKEITNMITEFIKVITNSIITGTINLTN